MGERTPEPQQRPAAATGRALGLAMLRPIEREGGGHERDAMDERKHFGPFDGASDYHAELAGPGVAQTEDRRDQAHWWVERATEAAVEVEAAPRRSMSKGEQMGSVGYGVQKGTRVTRGRWCGLQVTPLGSQGSWSRGAQCPLSKPG